jgi:hypothetical protein
MSVGFLVPVSSEDLLLVLGVSVGASVVLAPIYLIYTLTVSGRERDQRNIANHDAEHLARSLSRERNAKLAAAAIEAAERLNKSQIPSEPRNKD